MISNPRFLVRLVLVCWFLSTPASGLRADGGMVRLREQAGAYEITVFTNPTPLRAGPVDVSVLVLESATGEYVPGARVTVRLTARGRHDVVAYPATAEAATNKILYAAVFQLPRPGWWDVEVVVEGVRGPAVVQFGVEAAKPPPRWLEVWPWFTWPALAVALFGLHQLLIRRNARIRAGTTASAARPPR